MEDSLEYTFVPRFADFFESPYAQICLVLFLLGVTNSLSECLLNGLYSFFRRMSVTFVLTCVLGFSIGLIHNSFETPRKEVPRVQSCPDRNRSSLYPSAQ